MTDSSVMDIGVEGRRRLQGFEMTIPQGFGLNNWMTFEFMYSNSPLTFYGLHNIGEKLRGSQHRDAIFTFAI